MLKRLNVTNISGQFHGVATGNENEWGVDPGILTEACFLKELCPQIVINNL